MPDAGTSSDEPESRKTPPSIVSRPYNHPTSYIHVAGHGRTAGYPTDAAQIPACGIPAHRALQKMLASAISKTEAQAAHG